MKKLLSFVAILAVVATLMPAECTADLRGSFSFITAGPSGYTSGLTNGFQTPALRPAPFGAGDGYARVERWFAFTHRSTVVGFETTREIWQGLHRQQSGFAAGDPTFAAARTPLLKDPTAQISYTDPAWSADGKFLAYVQTDPQVTQSAIYVQEYMVSTTMSVAVTPVGGPILVVPLASGVHNRHPDWSPDGKTLVYDSDASGLSIDLYKVQVFPSVGSPVRLTFEDNRAEQNPAWAPDGVRVAYDTNRFGPNVIEIVDTSTGSVTLAETNFAAVGHSNPDWSSDGALVYYEAPQNEDAQANSGLWNINPATQAKCGIVLDPNGSASVSVSSLQNTTSDGIPFNTFLFESQAAGLGLLVWRGNPVNSCLPPLPMGIEFSPNTLNLDSGSGGTEINVKISFPAETEAAGYQAVSTNGPREGIRMRRTLFPRSPLMLGIRPKADFHADPGGALPDFSDNGTQSMNVKWARRTMVSRFVALGLINQQMLIQVDAYSNISGRAFRGFGILNVASSSLAGSVKLQQNSPNPFNPVTKIRFAVSKPGNVTLRIFNVRGELVKTLANGRYEMGEYEVGWDGRNASGRPVSSGVYYAKAMGEGGTTDVMKMVMAK